MSNSTNEVSSESTYVDACPRLAVNNESLFQQIEDYRDKIYELLNQTLEDLQIKGEITKSAPYEYETWVLIRLWRSMDESSGQQHRGEAKINISVLPTLRYPLVVSIEATSGGKTRRVDRIIDFTEDSARDLVNFISKPKQKLLKRLYVRHGIFFNKNRLKKRPRNLRVAVYGMLPVLGAMGFGFHPLAGIIGIVVCSIPLINLARMPTRVETTGKPPQNPRSLIRMDSWQSVIIDLGDLANTVRDDVTTELIDGKHSDANIELEEVSYLADTGKANRTQVVVNFRRAIAFVEIHSYGNDLYVDWEAFLNLGVWHEISTGIGYDAKSGAKVEYKDVERSLEILNEYDISDANFLIEWVHACLTRVIRRLKKERNIDQEFDFKIQRSDRRDVLHEGESKAKSARKGLFRKS